MKEVPKAIRKVVGKSIPIEVRRRLAPANLCSGADRFLLPRHAAPTNI
jgi:hypothetical protein